MNVTVTAVHETEVVLSDDQIKQVVEAYMRVYHDWRPNLFVKNKHVYRLRNTAVDMTTGKIGGSTDSDNLDEYKPLTKELHAAIVLMNAMEDRGESKP